MQGAVGYVGASIRGECLLALVFLCSGPLPCVPTRNPHLLYE